MTMDKIIKKSNTLDKNAKRDFKIIKQIFGELQKDLEHLLFDIEFMNILTYPLNIGKKYKSIRDLVFYTQCILISDVVLILFRIWDTKIDVNSLYRVSTILNANHSLKDFIINFYQRGKIITSEKAKKIIEQIPHTNKHKILQDIRKYRNEQIGHNLQNKTNPLLILGEIMIYADLTLKYASNFDNVVLGEKKDYSCFSKKSSCFLALEELKKIFLLDFQSLNCGIRENSLEYTGEDVAETAKEILFNLGVDKDIFL